LPAVVVMRAVPAPLLTTPWCNMCNADKVALSTRRLAPSVGPTEGLKKGVESAAAATTDVVSP
jgi:hypothetical protein